MKAADCSCLVKMNLILESSNDIIRSAFSSPGNPKMYSTSSASRHLTNRSDVFIGRKVHIVGLPVRTHSYYCYYATYLLHSKHLLVLLDRKSTRLNSSHQIISYA